MKRNKFKALGVKRKLAWSQALQKVIVDLSVELDLSRILKMAVEDLSELFEASGAALFLDPTSTYPIASIANNGLSEQLVDTMRAHCHRLAEWRNGATNPVLVSVKTNPPLTEPLLEAIREEGLDCMVLLPLVFAGNTLGTLSLLHDHPKTFDDDELAMLRAVAQQLAIAIRNALSFKREQEQEEALQLTNRQLAALLRTSNFLIEGNDLSAQLGLIAATISEVLGFRCITILIANDEFDTMEIAAFVGQRPNQATRFGNSVLPVDELLQAFCRDHDRVGASYLVHRTQSVEYGEGLATDGAKGCLQDIAEGGQRGQDDVLITPLYVRDKRLVGLLVIENTFDGKAPTTETLHLLELFAGQAAIAIRNSRLYDHLRQALKTKDAFLSMVSHELKTPLTSIMAYAQHLLLKLAETEEHHVVRSHLDVISAQSRRMARLVQELLDLTALEKGDLELKKTVIDLGDVVQKSIKTARTTSRKHRFLLNLPAHPVRIHADGGRIGQVVDDLVENAIKYSPEGGDVRIHLETKPTEAVVSVSDEGVGVATEHIPHIFERFYQADSNPRTRQFGGMGLGLYISRELVTEHGGKIWVESKKGKGSTFFFSLPLHVSKVSEGINLSRKTGPGQ